MSPIADCGMIAVLALPLVTALGIALFGRRSERTAARLAAAGAGSLLAVTLLLLLHRAVAESSSQELFLGELYRNEGYRFPFVLFLDRAGAVFLGLTSFLGAVIVKYCRYYLHREQGYARFFVTIFLFLLGMNLLSISGTIDVLFAGWEIVGISSFLLIAFYRDRPQPVRNALRAYTIYRICDVGILLGSWLGHLLWHESQRFSAWEGLARTGFGGASPEAIFFLSSLVLMAAAGKSAQFPFCYWLPRAMEGPTPSSAIFYGALSIHAGVFLLLRTFPLWHSLPAATFLVGAVGAVSAVVATLCGRVQSNVKGQIAYASITQVGLMLVELALGLQTLVLYHLVGNACLRCYQLLVSPSVVAHLLRFQAAAGKELSISDWSLERLMPSRLRSSLYAVALSEAYLESALRLGVWEKLAALGSRMQSWELPRNRIVGTLAAAFAVVVVAFEGFFPREMAAAALVALALVCSIVGLAEMRSALRSWNAVSFSVVLAGVSVWVLDPHAHRDAAVYLVGVIPGWVGGFIALRRIKSGRRILLSEFHGLVEERPAASTALFLSFLALAGFPITPAFLGEDLLLHYAAGGTLWLAAAISLAFVLNGLALARVFSRVCLGASVARKDPLPKIAV